MTQPAKLAFTRAYKGGMKHIILIKTNLDTFPFTNNSATTERSGITRSLLPKLEASLTLCTLLDVPPKTSTHRLLFNQHDMERVQDSSVLNADCTSFNMVI